jgi:plastocyanin
MRASRERRHHHSYDQGHNGNPHSTLIGLHANLRLVTTRDGRTILRCAVAAALVSTAALGACHSASTSPNAVDVIGAGSSFIPPSVDIPVNGIVRFNLKKEPNGDGHNVIFDAVPGAPADIPEAKDSVVSRTFAAAGTFSFSCTVHPGMAGRVVVK